MNKNFHAWNLQKSSIHENNSRLYFHEREVWFTHLGVNIGFEQDGKGERFGRPVVVLKKFNNEVFWAIPVTKRNKVGRFYFTIDLRDGVQRSVILSQLRLLDSKRLYQKLGVLRRPEYEKLVQATVNLMLIH